MPFLAVLFLLNSICCEGRESHVTGRKTEAKANRYFVAVDGSDDNKGTEDSPFATISKAYDKVRPGDSIFIRAGKYNIKPGTAAGGDNRYTFVFDLNKSGKKGMPIFIGGYRDERPVLDFSSVKSNRRIAAFCVRGNYHHLRNFEVTGVQVVQTAHTQSECFRNDGGSYNVYENLAMHDGMGIGFYLLRGHDNLILNCDAYDNMDNVSENGSGENTDGFGGHPADASSTGNVFRGCRAWNNADDGFDLINSHAAVRIENCWAFFNGYRPHSTDGKAGNGTGIKAGGYGMSLKPKAPTTIPHHIVNGCIAYHNKNRGIYANHHLGGIIFINNTAFDNPYNYDMTNRRSLYEAVNVPGYGHILRNNVSFKPRSNKPGRDITMIDETQCIIENNTFLPGFTVLSTDFYSLDASLLKASRKADGSLPDIDFLKPKPRTAAYEHKAGYTFNVLLDDKQR